MITKIVYRKIIKDTAESFSLMALNKGLKIERDVKAEISLIDEVLFFIKDTGIGIKEEDKEKIFERFFQVDSSSTRRYGGTGLGLSIVKEMVAALSGKIWVESEPDKGSKFCFTITER